MTKVLLLFVCVGGACDQTASQTTPYQGSEKPTESVQGLQEIDRLKNVLKQLQAVEPLYSCKEDAEEAQTKINDLHQDGQIPDSPSTYISTDDATRKPIDDYRLNLIEVNSFYEDVEKQVIRLEACLKAHAGKSRQDLEPDPLVVGVPTEQRDEINRLKDEIQDLIEVEPQFACMEDLTEVQTKILDLSKQLKKESDSALPDGNLGQGDADEWVKWSEDTVERYEIAERRVVKLEACIKANIGKPKGPLTSPSKPGSIVVECEPADACKKI